MRYKIGEKVRVKDDLRCGSYGNEFVTMEMLRYKGRILKVKDVLFNDKYILEGTGRSKWNDEMLDINFESNTIKKEINESFEELNATVQKLMKLINEQNEEIEMDGKFWDDFKRQRIAINCTFKEALIFLRKCDKQGIRFRYGEDETLEQWFNNRIRHMYDDEICSMYNGTIYGGISHSDKEFYIDEGYKVVDFSNINSKTELEDFSTDELIQELLRRQIK